jgi:hypothetical protein
MHKVRELFASNPTNSSGSSPAYANGSGGGGPVEAVFWIQDGPVSTQWRMRGRAFVLAPDVETEGAGEGVELLKAEVGPWMRCRDEKLAEGWSWARELGAAFGNLSGGMRGTLDFSQSGIWAGDSKSAFEQRCRGDGVLTDDRCGREFS